MLQPGIPQAPGEGQLAAGRPLPQGPKRSTGPGPPFRPPAVEARCSLAWQSGVQPPLHPPASLSCPHGRPISGWMETLFKVTVPPTAFPTREARFTPPQLQLRSPCLLGGWMRQPASISACKSSALYAALITIVAALIIPEMLPSGPSGHTQPPAPSAPPTCGHGPGRKVDEPSPVPSRGRGMDGIPCTAGPTPDPPKGSMALEKAPELLTQKFRLDFPLYSFLGMWAGLVMEPCKPQFCHL